MWESDDREKLARLFCIISVKLTVALGRVDKVILTLLNTHVPVY